MSSHVPEWIRRRGLRLVGLTLLLAVSLAIAACGSSDSDNEAEDSGSSATSETTPEKVAIDPEYDGPDKPFFKTLRTPEKRDGQSFKVGFLEPSGAEITHDIWIKGAREQVEALGGTLIVKDAQLNAAKQASQLREFLTQGVDAIIVVPLVAGALRPGLERARAKGIPVIGITASFDMTKPLEKGYDVSVGPGWDYGAFSVAKTLSEQSPGAKFAVLGLGAPIPVLSYEVEREKYWASEFGLEFVGRVDSQGGDPASATAATATLITKYPDAEILFTWNDTSALAAAAAAGQEGATDLAIGDALGGSPVIKPAIEEGRVAAVYAAPWRQMGQQSAVAAYSLLTDQNTPIPEAVNVPSIVLTEENVSSYDFGD
jgi:ribose transport system substrate-binding protein